LALADCCFELAAAAAGLLLLLWGSEEREKGDFGGGDREDERMGIFFSFFRPLYYITGLV
jgi:hypothetical protein